MSIKDDIAAIEAALPIITPEDRQRYTEATQPARLRRILDTMAEMASALEDVERWMNDESPWAEFSEEKLFAALAKYRGEK